jgi:hypothetical protein
MLLAGMAASAVSGCVAVGQPAPTPSPGPEISSAVPEHGVEPQIVQGPVREVLEAVVSPPPPEPDHAASRSSGGSNAPAALPGASGGGAAGYGRAETRRGGAGHSARQWPAEHAAGVPRAVAVPPPHLSGGAICALGRAYGHWTADSPQAGVCHQALGR